MNRVLYILFFQLTIAIHANEIDDRLEKLLTAHPEILSLNSELLSKRANANHETTYPDPKLGIAFKNYPTRSYSLNDRANDTPGMTGIEYSISQEIPFPGRLTLQGKSSRLNEMEFLQYSQSRKNQFLLEYLSQLVRFKSSEKKIQINDRIRKILESQKSISASNFASGTSNLSKALKLQVESTLFQEREIELNRDSKNAIASLEYFKIETENSPKIQSDKIAEYLESKFQMIKSQKTILKEKIIENPNYKLAAVAIERAKNESKLAHVLHAPDTEIFFSYMKRRNRTYIIDNGPLNYQVMDTNEYSGDLFSVGMNVRVPVWSFFSSHHLNEKSSENTKSKSYELEKNKLYLEASFEKLLVTLESLDAQIGFHQKRLIPEFKKSLSASSSQYASGKMNLIEVLTIKIELEKANIQEEELLEKKEITTLLLLELTDNLIKDKEN